MCLGDWRLGRFLRSRVSNVGVTLLGNIVLNPNRQRVGVMFGSQALVNQFDLFVGTTGGNNGILTTTPGMQPVIFNIRDHGDLPMGAWFADTTGGIAFTMCIVEWFLPESVLQESDEYAAKFFGG